MTGALGEALESHFAEQVKPDQTCLRWGDLFQESRCPDPSDYCSDRDHSDESASIDWCTSYELRSGRTVYLPHLFVSLDFTLPTDTVIERSSAGLAIGTCLEEAIETALLEAIERDAIGEWERMPTEQKAVSRIRLESISFDWFHVWSARVRAIGSHLRVFALRAIEGTTVCAVFLSGPGEFGPAYRTFMGTAAHGSPELALFKALAEAFQSRLTVISGSRDDMLPSSYQISSPGSGLGLAGLVHELADFASLHPTCSVPLSIARRLEKLGYADVLVRRLNPDCSSIPVVKVFVPGLGSLSTPRRNGI